MAKTVETKDGGAGPPLEKTLFGEPYRFSFFQAIRLLERLSPGRTPVGRSQKPDGNAVEPAQEVAHFRTPATLNFPPSEIHDLTRDETEEDGGPPVMTVAFMGMTGPSGVLPSPYTELMMDRVRAGDEALHSFLDLFSHRMISFHFRAWEKYRFAVAYERTREESFTEYLFDLIGLGTGGLRDRLGFDDQGLLRYAGLMAQRPHSSSAMAAILGDYFDAPARIVSFTGQWFRLESNDLTRLGKSNSRLGDDTIAGTRVWDNQSKFRVRLGPLKFHQFKEFLPIGSAYKPLMALIRLLAGAEFDFDVQLALKAEEVPGTILTTRARRKPMVGWNTWLKTRPFSNDDEQVVLAGAA